MSDRQALTEAIRAHPDDDTPRLVLADWYGENGEPARGEFVRVQCELARLDPASDRYPELHVRQLQMLAECEREWLGEWADRLVRWEFRRGMLDEVVIQPEPFCRGGEALFREHPVWRVAFVNEEGESLAQPAIRDVLSQPHSHYLRAIDAAACRPDEQAAAMFGGRIDTNAWLSELARAAALTELRELNLFGGTRGGREDFEPEAWEQFCAAEHLRGLTHLDLSNLYDYREQSAAWESDFRELAASTFAPELRSLRFDGCHLGSDALLHLTRSGRFPRLRTLAAGGAEMFGSLAPVLPELLDPGVLPSLRDLTIPYGRHLVGVADHPGWSRFERLGLVGNDDHRDRARATHEPIWRAVFRSPHIRPASFTIGSTGYYAAAETSFWEELTGAAWFPQLSELAISFYDQTCAPLFDRPLTHFPRLRSLWLSRSTELVERLAAWPGLANLVELGLSGASEAAQPDAAVRLFESPHLTPRLSRLGASGLCRSPEVVAALAGCAALAGLTHLDFAFNELSESSATAVAASPHLRHLRSLHTWSEWEESGAHGWLTLADPRVFPQLRDVVVGSGSSEEVQSELRHRFGARLRVFSDC